MKQRKVISKWVYYFTLGVALIIVYKLVSDFSALCLAMKKIISVIMPFIMAILLAYLFYKPAVFFESKLNKNIKLQKIARPISVLITYVLATFIVILLFKCVIPPIVKSTTELVKHAPEYLEETKTTIKQADNNSWMKKIELENVINQLENYDYKSLITVEKIGTYISTVVGIFGTIFNVFVTIIVSIYILLERKEIKEFFKRFAKAILSHQNYLRVCKYFDKSNHILLDFIYCQILDGIIIGILVSIAMTIIGVKYAVLLGTFIGLFNIIPYFGAIIAIAISAIITLFTGGINQTIIMAITVIILQQIDSNIINPKILGDGLKISPILVIFAVTVGGAFFGIVGMFLSVPAAAIIKVLISDYIEIKTKLKKYRKSVKEI